MKILKLVLGVLAGLWCLSIAFKGIRLVVLTMGGHVNSTIGGSVAFAVLGGMLLSGLLCYVLIKSALDEGESTIRR